MAAARVSSSAARELPAIEAASSRPEEQGASHPRLDVVDRRRRASPPVHRQANLLRALGVLLVVGALAVTAAAHTFVASDQQRVDTLQAELSQSLGEQQDLQLSRAELESPVRVLNIAERQLGMVAPGSVSYLSPVNPGPSVAQAGASAARAAAAASAATGRESGSSMAGETAQSTITELSKRGAKSGTRPYHTGGRPTAISPPG
ncbi:MAG: hypothetical protein ACLP36_03800 [Acidimicrobiales bacterium]|jgi:cell division protein FtsL